MTSIWLASKFEQDSSGNIIVASNVYDEGDSISVPESVLTSWITSDPPTYTELSALPAAKAGWQPIFDQWKTKGIVL